MDNRIESGANQTLKLIRRLGREAAARRETGLMLCEGRKTLDEALASGVTPAHVVIPEGYDGLPLPPIPEAARVMVTPQRLFDSLSALEASQPVLFTAPIPDFSLRPTDASRFVVLDRLQDPGNVGSIIRTAYALDVGAVLLTPGCADPSGPKTLRAAAGTLFRARVMRGGEAEILKYLHEAGVTVYTTGVSRQALPLGRAELDPNGCAAVIGNEGAGVSAFWKDFPMLTIPMPGHCESLGAAVAAALILWEMRKGARAC